MRRMSITNEVCADDVENQTEWFRFSSQSEEGKRKKNEQIN